MAVRSYEDVPGPRKAMRTTVPCIPDDVIVFNILSQLPSKSVIRCKAVCKAWLAAISSERFIRAHLEFSRARSTATLLVSRRYMEWQHKFMDSTCMGFYRYIGGSRLEIVHSQVIPKGIGSWVTPSHCDGLIIVSTENQVIVVCNPATKEFVQLPKGSDCVTWVRKSRVGLGFDPCSNRYKAARFFYETVNNNGGSETVCRFEVHTLGTRTWRRTAADPHPIFLARPAHVQGYLYWRIDLPPSKHPKAFVRFSLSEEMFSLTPYPPSKKAEPVYFIELLEGKLCCACFTERFEVVEIWTLDSDKSPEWTRYCTVSVPKDLVVALPASGEFRFPKILFNHQKDLLLTSENKVYQYNIGTGEVKRIVAKLHDFRYYDSNGIPWKIFLGSNELAFNAVNYTESLVPISGYTRVPL